MDSTNPSNDIQYVYNLYVRISRGSGVWRERGEEWLHSAYSSYEKAVKKANEMYMSGTEMRIEKREVL